MCNSIKHPTGRRCCVCEKPLYGRSDKVFCDIHCKNHYHAEKRKTNRTFTQESIKILNKNYDILCQLLGPDNGKVVIKKIVLERAGFNFEFISNSTSFHSANQFKFIKMNVFEFTWFYSKNQTITILRDLNQEKFHPFVYKRWEQHYRNQQTKT